MTFPTPQPRFQSFFGGRFFSQNWHFGITKRITKHNFLVLQSTYLYFVSNEDHTFEKKNVSFLLVTSTLRAHFAARSFHALHIVLSRNKYGLIPLIVSKERFD